MYHRTLVTLLSAVAAALASPTASCSANNCLRAVQASAFSTRHGTADCASYFLTTVTPATTTITATAYTTSTTTTTVPMTTTVVNTITNLVTITDETTSTAVVNLLAKRFDAEALVRHPHSITLAPRQMTVAPSSIPAYASACSGSVRYSSACSCVGFTRSTTTAPTPSTTTTSTSTITVTATTTSVQTNLATVTATATTIDDVVQVVTFTQCPQATPTFILQASGGGPGVDGQYAQVISTGDGANDALAFVSDPAAASQLHIDIAGHLTDGTQYANTDAGTTIFLFYFDTQAQIAAAGYVYATCSVSPSNALQCVDQTQSIFQICPGMTNAGAGVVLGSSVRAGCMAFSFTAICI